MVDKASLHEALAMWTTVPNQSRPTLAYIIRKLRYNMLHVTRDIEESDV
mgnify:CR=1 FL=1